MSSIYEWTERACALPGAPDIWLLAADGKGLITVPDDEVLDAIASDGTWWETTGRSDRPWVLNVDHPATEGVLLRLIGAGIFGVWITENWKDTDEERVGYSCIRVAESVGKWSGGEG